MYIYTHSHTHNRVQKRLNTWFNNKHITDCHRFVFLDEDWLSRIENTISKTVIVNVIGKKNLETLHTSNVMPFLCKNEQN